MRFEKITKEEADNAYFECSCRSDTWRDLHDLELPTRSTEGSAGYDFHCPYRIKAKKGSVVRVPLLVRVVEMPKNVVLLVFNRSSLSLIKGLRLDNAVAVIDRDFDKCIWFQATATEDIELRKGDKICQGIFVPFLLVDGDDAKGKRDGGFGSTGR